MATTNVDLSQVTKLSSDLKAATARADAAALPVVKRAAQNVKTDAIERIKAQMAGRSHIKGYPSTIGYNDPTQEAGVTTVEIGPNITRGPGQLWNLIEFGSSNNPPLPHFIPAAEEEAPKFEEQLTQAVTEAILSDGR